MTVTAKRFRSFLATVADKLFPNAQAQILSPESPPNWTRFGWKAGWIIEEGHTGLQWWVTEDVAWESLTSHLGRTSRQKKETFAKWYGDLLERLSRELGKPLSLKSLRYREMDMGAFEGRPLIEEEDWWVVTLEAPQSGQWDLVFSERFLRVFEEDVESSPEPDPPWTFLELWDRLDSRQKKDLLQQIGGRDGILNHLSALVVSGNLEHDELVNLMALRPREDLDNLVDRRRDQLSRSTKSRRDQTLDQWKHDAVAYLTKTVGKWLEDGELPAARWEEFESDWTGYRREILTHSFDERRWRTLWNNLSTRDLKQILPRLNLDKLGVSLEGLDKEFKKSFMNDLPENFSKRLGPSESNRADRMDVLEAREQLFEQGRSVVQSMDYDLDGYWSLESRDN